jgi:hypothetical protein
MSVGGSWCDTLQATELIRLPSAEWSYIRCTSVSVASVSTSSINRPAKLWAMICRPYLALLNGLQFASMNPWRGVRADGLQKSGNLRALSVSEEFVFQIAFTSFHHKDSEAIDRHNGLDLFGSSAGARFRSVTLGAKPRFPRLWFFPVTGSLHFHLLNQVTLIQRRRDESRNATDGFANRNGRFDIDGLSPSWDL